MRGWAMRDSVSTSVRWEMKWEEARQCSAKHGVTARSLSAAWTAAARGKSWSLQRGPQYLRSLKLRAGKGRREKKRVGCHASGRDAQSSAGRGRGICGDGGV